MNKTLRLWLGPFSAAAIFAISLFITIGILTKMNSASAQDNPQAQPTPVAGGPSLAVRTVAVSGSGSAAAVPDMAVITLGIHADAKTAREALTQNTTQMQALINAVKASGVAQADIRTLNIQIFPRYSNPVPDQAEPKAPEIIGYTATNSVEVTVRSLANLGSLIDTAVNAGGNEISGIRFDLSSPQAAMDQAREAAMKDARHRAEQLASLSNATLGAVISVTESSQQPLPYEAGARLSMAADSAVPVEAGTQQMIVNVQVTWEMTAE